MSEVQELVDKLERMCSDWEDHTVVPVAVVRGIIGRYDEVSKLNQMYYGE